MHLHFTIWKNVLFGFGQYVTVTILFKKNCRLRFIVGPMDVFIARDDVGL